MTPVRLRELSTSRQALVRLCQLTNYGQIRDLAVQHGEPVLTNSQTAVLREIKLDPADADRNELALDDFVLPAELTRLMALLDEIQSGIISRIEIRAGVPRRITVQKPISELGAAFLRDSAST